MSLPKRNAHKASALEQYKRTLQLVKRMENHEPFDFKELLKSYLQLFVTINNSLETGSNEEGRESLWILHEFRQMIKNQKDKILDQKGIIFEEMASLVDNPNFFTQDQWLAVQEVKKNLTRTGMKLSDVLLKRVGSV